MLHHFLTCIRATYTHTKEGGDFAVTYDESTQTLYLLFQWSNGREDWQNNLAFRSVCVNPTAPKGERWYCHRGFLKVWRAMEKEILSATEWYLRRYDVKELICVGYSHGAALSLLATQRVTASYGDRIPVRGYGFGCPRVVKGKLPPHIQQQLSHFTSVRNIPDLVTHLPPKIFGFHHVGLYEIGEKGVYNAIDAHRAEAYIDALTAKETPRRGFCFHSRRATV